MALITAPRSIRGGLARRDRRALGAVRRSALRWSDRLYTAAMDVRSTGRSAIQLLELKAGFNSRPIVCALLALSAVAMVAALILTSTSP